MRNVTDGGCPRRPVDLEHLLSQRVGSAAVSTEQVDTVHVQGGTGLALGSKLLSERGIGGGRDEQDYSGVRGDGVIPGITAGGPPLTDDRIGACCRKTKVRQSHSSSRSRSARHSRLPSANISSMSCRPSSTRIISGMFFTTL